MKLFNKPHWLRPEINDPIYWVHLVILSVTVLWLLQAFKFGDMLTIKNVLWSVPMLAIGDVVAHTILGLD